MIHDSVFDNATIVPELLDAVPHGIAILDTKLCIVAMNQTLEAMTGYMTNEAKGIYADFVLRTNVDNNRNITKIVLENGQPASIEGNMIGRNRTKKNVHLTISRLHDQDDTPIGIIMVMEDLSVLRTKGGTVHEEIGKFDILGHSKQMEEVFKLMAVLARTDASILITGETGTGKDKIAEELHASSQRGRHPFIKVNCGALPESLLESELFGHAKGAFTGAVTENAGMFRLANKGTIFLTEIGDLSLSLQVKLLSVLDDHAFYPVGGSKRVEVDVRVIAATHRPLRQEVQDGNFREDLFYRLNVLHLHLPPLREREGDLRLLLDYFLQRSKTKLKRSLSNFSQKAVEILSGYHFPGNVRELRNIVEYAVTVCQTEQIQPEDLPLYISQPIQISTPAHLGTTQPPTESPQIYKKREVDGKLPGWAEVEKEKILTALHEVNGNRSKAAGLLGWGRTTLWRKLKKYKLT